MIQTQPPRRIEEHISAQQVGNETVVYDGRCHKAYCLNRTSAAIWRMCDGAHTVAEIAVAASLQLEAPVSEDVVRFALEQLHGDGLLAAMPASSVPLLTRRDLVEKLGSRALIMLPMIAALMVPETARAFSGIVTGGVGNRGRAVRARPDQDSAPDPQPEDSDSRVR